MSISKLVSNYSAFNEWANSKIVNCLLKQDKSIFYKNCLSSYPSIDTTLQHIVKAQKFWFQFISEAETSNFDWSANENQAEKNCEELIIISTSLKEKSSAFSEEELLKMLSLNMPWAKNNLCRYEYIIHVINHSSFHRGQIITMLRNLEIVDGIPNTDYNIFNCQ